MVTMKLNGATRKADNLKLAVEEFNKATEIDPSFALAWVGVADSLLLSTSWADARDEDMYPIIEDAVKNALAIDNGLGEAYASLAWIHRYYGRNDEVEIAYQKAIELSPNYASAYQWYSGYIGNSDPLRIQESLDLLQKAAKLDPRSRIIGLNLGSYYNDRGLYTLAERQFRKVIEIDPDFTVGYIRLADLYSRDMGQFDKALALLSIETQLAHNHLYDWHTVHQVSMYDLIRHEPGYQEAWAEYERRLSVQRENIDLEREAGE